MLPYSYQLPAAVVLVLSGALTCVAGYRLFRIVLAIYGFIFGAMIASSMMGVTNTSGMIVAALVGGLAGAVILVLAYFVGVVLVGAGLGALVVHVGWSHVAASGDPPAVLLIVMAVVGAIAAMVLQRYVVIVGTAFGGAWTIIVGAIAVADALAHGRVRTADAWVLYPLTPAAGQRWVPVAWIALGVLGTAVQIGATARGRK